MVSLKFDEISQLSKAKLKEVPLVTEQLAVDFSETRLLISASFQSKFY